MKITPQDIARALIDSILDGKTDADAACDGALALLHEKCPGTTRKIFLKIVEREVKRHGAIAAGMLVVPNEHSLKTEHITPHLAQKTGKTVYLDRKIEPELIGGAVLLVDHRRLDASVQGALRSLLQMCLQPLD
jgi:F0F1-type ATP synthase delta subunit